MCAYIYIHSYIYIHIYICNYIYIYVYLFVEHVPTEAEKIPTRLVESTKLEDVKSVTGEGSRSSISDWRPARCFEL